MAAIILGKNHLRWCLTCNLPILEKEECPVCGAKTKEMIVTPPSDARPAFPASIDRIREIADLQFGKGVGLALIPDGHLVVLNKAPSIDRMDEVVCDGAILASMKYDIGIGWRLILRMQGAMRAEGVLSKGFVVCDPSAVKFVQDSKNLMAPGVIDAHPDVSDGDEVLIVTPEMKVIATGIAKMSAAGMIAADKGVGVKTRWYKPEEPLVSDVCHTWEEATEANAAAIEKRSSEAIRFIHSTMEKYADLPAMVSFSGGKDSLATLLLTVDAGLKLPAMFVDTGLEFNETVQHVHETTERHGLQLIEEKAPVDAFFGNVIQFGPPSKDFRWCCKTNKLGPTVKAITTNFPNGVLSFIGQRKYESEARNAKPRIWTNPWTPGQIGASPIQNWCAMHVWLYIFSKKEPFNVWYTRGLDRIGCFLCPASDLAEFEIVAGASDRYPQWDSYLSDFQEKYGLPPEWKKYGLWRWKKAPQSIRDEIKRLTGKDVPELTKRKFEDSDGPLTMRRQEGYAPCVIGYSVEAAVSGPIDLKRLKPFTHALGWSVVLNETDNTLEVDYVTFYGEGAIISKANIKNDADQHMDEAWQLVVRSHQCVGCGLCVARCKPRALYIENGKVEINEDECIYCKDCYGACPAVRFAADDGGNFDQ